MRPTFAEVNLSNLKFNYLNIRKKCNVKIMAVVKADAYGHGAAEVVKALNSLIDKKTRIFCRCTSGRRCGTVRTKDFSANSCF